MRLAVGLAIAGAAVLAPASAAHADGSRCPAGGTTIPPDASIQSSLRAGTPGQAFCLLAGTYHPAGQINPRQDQALYGVPGATVIDGTGLASVFNGSVGGTTDVTGVGLYDLIVQRATTNDIRTNSGWVLDGVVAQDSGMYGIVVRGTDVVVRDSVARNNDRFGISGAFSVNALIQGNEIVNNNTGLNPPGYSGATHFTNTVGMQVIDNWVHDNHGRGIWFDIDSADALVQGNVVTGQIDYPYSTRNYPIGDGIRIEISCRITVEGNTVSANQGPQIALDGADDSLVEGNTVAASAYLNGQPAIRVAPQDNRTSEPLAGWKNCDPTLRTAVNDTIRNNDITMTAPATYSGVLQKSATSDTTGATFDGDTYHVSDCAAKLWRWWNGSSLVKASFAKLQGIFGQELAGSCATI